MSILIIGLSVFRLLSGILDIYSLPDHGNTVQMVRKDFPDCIVSEMRWRTETKITWIKHNFKNTLAVSEIVNTSETHRKETSSFLWNAISFTLCGIPTMEASIAPDGGHSLFFDYDNQSAWWILLDNDTGSTRKIPAAGGGYTIPPRVVWASDSSHWFEIPQYFHTYVRVHSLSKDESSDRIEVPDLHFEGEALGMDATGQLLLIESGRQAIIRVDLTSNPASIERYPLNIPHEYNVLGVTLSPKGDRLLWTLRSSSLPGSFDLFPAKTKHMDKKGDWVGFYTSSVNNAKMSLIGKYYISPDQREYQTIGTDLIYPCIWLPSGKAISFYHEGKLFKYTFALPKIN